MDGAARPRRARRRRSGHRRGHCEHRESGRRRHGHATGLVCRRPRSAAAGAPAGHRHRRVSVRSHERGRDRRFARCARGGVRRQRRRRSRPAAGDVHRRITRDRCGDSGGRAGAVRDDQRRGRRPAAANRIHLLPSDLRRAHHCHGLVCGAADLGAADRVREPASRRDRRAARAWILALARGDRRAVASRR